MNETEQRDTPAANGQIEAEKKQSLFERVEKGLYLRDGVYYSLRRENGRQIRKSLHTQDLHEGAYQVPPGFVRRLL